MKWAITWPNDGKRIHGHKKKALEERKSKITSTSGCHPSKDQCFFIPFRFNTMKHSSIMRIQQPTSTFVFVRLQKPPFVFVKPLRLNQPWRVLCQRTQTPNDLGSQISQRQHHTPHHAISLKYGKIRKRAPNISDIFQMSHSTLSFKTWN